MVKGTTEGVGKVAGVFPGAGVSGWDYSVGGKGSLLYSVEERRGPHAHAYIFDHDTYPLHRRGRVSDLLA